MNFMSRISAIACIGFTLACGGEGIPGTTTSPVVFDPAPGTFGSLDSVSLTVAGASEIYITTDGSTPTVEDCESNLYTPGTDFPLVNNANNAVNVLYVIGGVPTVETFNFVVGTVSGGPYGPNRQMMLEWRDWSNELRDKFPEPGGTGHVGTHACEGGGQFDWDVTGFFLSPCTGGDNLFTYSNCHYTDANGVTFVANGSVAGSYCQDGSGSSSGNVTFAAGGDWTGSLTDSVVNDNTRTPISPAFYNTTCDQAGCGTDVVYRWEGSDWTEEAPADGAGGFGCSAPSVTITQNFDGDCLTVSGSNLTAAACDGADDQEWLITGADPAFVIESVSNPGQCITDDGNEFVLTACGGSEQAYDIHGSNSDGWFIENTARDACIYQYDGVLYNNGLAYAANGNCTWALLGYPSMKWSFITEEGAEVTPTGAAAL